MQTSHAPTVEDFLKTQITGNLLRHAAGRQIFCRHCQGILDWQRTVILEIRGKQSGKTHGTIIICDACYDAKSENLASAATAGEAKAKEPLEVEITDGRDFTDDNHRVEYHIAQEASSYPTTRVKHEGGRKIQSKETVQGFPVTFPGMDWAEFFVYQRKEHVWHVCELQTGAAIGSCATMKGAARKAAESLAKAGREAFLNIRNNVLTAAR